MEDQELHQLLEKLHGEIEQAKTADPKSLELLQHIEKDLRELVERSEGNLEKPKSQTIRRMEDTIRSLEVTHPSLTVTLSELLDILSNAGI
jgi:hypothetical protein